MASNFIDPSTTPSMMPPEGVIPNFTNPVSIAYISRDVTCVFLSLMLVFLALRIYSRAVITHSFGVDDILHVVAGASITVFCGILLSLLDAPNGRHLWDVPLSVLTDSYLQINFTFVLISALSTMLIKVSLLALYLRVFHPVREVAAVIYSCIGVLISFYLSTMIIAELVVGVPRPGGGGWQPAQIRYGPFGLNISVVRGVFGVVSDFTILLIPLTQIVKLHLPLKRKVILLCIFLTGLLACVSSIITCVFRFRELHNEDYTWANIMPNTFATIELTVGHICGSMPTLPSLVMFLRKNKTLLSVLQYLRSSRNRRRDSGDPTSEPLQDTVEKLPRIPNGRLTGLRSFISKARLTNFSTKRTGDKNDGQSKYLDLESIDADYHSQLRMVTNVAKGDATSCEHATRAHM